MTAVAVKIAPSPKIATIALLAVAAVLVAAGWFLAISPKQSKISTLGSQISSAQAELAQRQATGSHSSAKAAKAAQLKSLRAAMPDSVAMPDVVDELNSLARSAGVSLDSITPGVAVQDAGYNAIPITAIVTGHFFSVQHFLRAVRTQVLVHGSKVEAHGRLFDVQTVDLQQTEPAPNVTATLTLNAFVYTGVTPVAPAATTTTTDSGSSD